MKGTSSTGRFLRSAGILPAQRWLVGRLHQGLTYPQAQRLAGRMPALREQRFLKLPASPMWVAR